MDRRIFVIHYKSSRQRQTINSMKFLYLFFKKKKKKFGRSLRTRTVRDESFVGIWSDWVMELETLKTYESFSQPGIT